MRVHHRVCTPICTSDYSLGKVHLNAILDPKERKLYLSPGPEAYMLSPYAVEALTQHGASKERGNRPPATPFTSIFLHP